MWNISSYLSTGSKMFLHTFIKRRKHHNVFSISRVGKKIKKSKHRLACSLPGGIWGPETSQHSQHFFPAASTVLAIDETEGGDLWRVPTAATLPPLVGAVNGTLAMDSLDTDLEEACEARGCDAETMYPAGVDGSSSRFCESNELLLDWLMSWWRRVAGIRGVSSMGRDTTSSTWLYNVAWLVVVR